MTDENTKRMSSEYVYQIFKRGFEETNCQSGIQSD